MTLKDIFEKCKGLEIDEQRVVNDEYIEVVFLNKNADQWNTLFTDSLGPAAKPAGKAASESDQKLTKDYGGIFDNQTLFKKDFNGFTLIAMFWPWGDSQHTTLKAASLKR